MLQASHLLVPLLACPAVRKARLDKRTVTRAHPSSPPIAIGGRWETARTLPADLYCCWRRRRRRPSGFPRPTSPTISCRLPSRRRRPASGISTSIWQHSCWRWRRLRIWPSSGVLGGACSCWPSPRWRGWDSGGAAASVRSARFRTSRWRCSIPPTRCPGRRRPSSCCRSCSRFFSAAPSAPRFARWGRCRSWWRCGRSTCRSGSTMRWGCWPTFTSGPA